MRCHSNVTDDPLTVELKCFSCGRLYDDLLSDVQELLKSAPPGYVLLGMCINCDPAALDNDYSVVDDSDPS